MKKLMKISSIALAMTLVMGALAGCSGGSSPTETQGTTPAATDANNQTQANSDSGNSGSSAKLLWWQIGGTPQDNATVLAEMNKYSKEKIGVEVDIKYADWGEWEQKIPTIINSGESFDLMFTNYNYYANHVNLGAFADITDIVNNDVPKLKELIPQLVWDGVTIKDRIYSVPTYKDSSSTQFWAFDKDVVVDQLGIDITKINSVKDLDPVLRQVKEANPTGEYPLFCDRNGINSWPYGYDTCIGGVEVLGVNVNDKDAKLVNIYEQPEIVEELKLIHQWYSDEIINPDAPTVTELPKHRLVYSAQGFEGADAIWSATGGYNVISKKFYGPIYSTATIQGSVNAVSANSKYVTESVKYLELVNTDPTMRNLLAYGIEGTHYNKTDEGTIDYINDTYRPALYSQATFFTLMPVAPNPPDQYDLVRKQNEEATASPVLGFVFDPANVETEVANCKNETTRFMYEIKTGARNPEEALPQLNEALKNAGLEKIMQEGQSQIDAFLGK